MSESNVVIRLAAPEDSPAIQSILSYYILETTCSWRCQVMNQAETLQWLISHMSKEAHRVWVAEIENSVVGYSCLSDFRSPEAYSVCAEDTVYVRPEFSGFGIGNALMNAIKKQARENDIETIVAAIDSSNQSSIRFHEKHGFELAGLLRRVGYKKDRWLDLLLMTYAVHASSK